MEGCLEGIRKLDTETSWHPSLKFSAQLRGDDFMQYLEIRNWREFQHYKDRNPPWIKLHFKIFNSPDWVMVDDASKLLAIVCMLLASQKDGKIPNNPEYIKKVAHLSKTPDLTPLINIGFFEPLADASSTQADAIIEKRREYNIEEPEAPELSWVPKEEFLAFKKMRKASKKPLTEHAEKLIIADLLKLKEQGHDPKLVLEASIKNGWQGVFPLKDKPKKTGGLVV